MALCAVAFFALSVAFTAWQEPLPLQRAFIAGLMLCIFGMLLFAFGRFATALLVGGGLFLLLKFVAVLKLRYLDSQLMPSDFIYYLRSSLLDTLLHYPHLYLAALGVAALLPLLYLAWRWDWRVLAPLRPRHAAGMRIGGTALYALAFWLCLLPTGPFAQVHSRNAWEKMSDDAQLTNFFVNLRDAGVQLPPMADEATAERDWGATASGRVGGTPPYPDIVQVLEESTFDPSIYDACNVPSCRVAMFRPDARTRAHGMLRVHTFGGGTWVSEFAALTGMPQDIFGAGGMYAPYVLAPNVHDALALQLRRLGYLTIGIYPTGADFINGRNAYRAYGFDHLYGADELGLEEWEESDAQMFAAAKRIYDKVKTPDQPVFVMILTLNQHGPHDHQPMSKLPKPYRNLLHGLPRDAALNFDTYLARLHASDAAMRALEHAFLDRPQPTVLLHFGDHQPSFNGLIRDLPRRLPADLQAYRDYLTYYMLKSNFAGPPLPQYPLLDIAFLPDMVLQAAGVPVDAYFAASTELRDRCDGRYDDCAVPGLLASYHAWTIGRLHVYQ
ncbi:sulfatase [Rhodanobacter denitrificans]|uniref:Sulfatase n=1 Tax=Rhodanobacter denitrificans TaxID=666685 RepID=A0A368KC30_9GAMM|nr:sulfatase-like hydrolase/transferase [Rhodanobacter denitrificans]RCS29500.1 sulfatase [Rhodanobacter denitrificans]